MSFTNRLDAYQQTHRWLGVPLAVAYKFFEDQGGYLSALITYYGVVSLFPLLLLAVAVVGLVLQGHPGLDAKLVNSTVAQFPIIGPQVKQNIHGFSGSGVALAVGIIGAVYGGLGIAQSAQNALNNVWGVPRRARLNPLRARLRSLMILPTLGGGFLFTSGLSGLATGISSYTTAVHLGVWGRIGAVTASLLANLVIFTVSFRVLTTKAVTLRQVALGAAVAAVAWQGLQLAGTFYIAHKLKGATEAYGTFGIVIGLITWIYIEAVIVIVAAELNVVLHERLWPRSILSPFTDNILLTDADQRAYQNYAQMQQFKAYETIDVAFPESRKRSGRRQPG